jgi:DNA-binding transcriptional LysR family regulator
MKDHPRISNHVAVVDPEQIRRRVLDGQADFGLTMSPQPLPGVAVTRSARLHLRAVVKANSEFKAKKAMSLSEFFQRPTVLPDSSVHLRDVVDIAAVKYKIRLHPVLTSNNLELMRAMVRAGCGFGLMTTLEEAPEHIDGLAYVPISDRGIPPLTLSLIIAPERRFSITAILARRYFEIYFDDLERQADRVK